MEIRKHGYDSLNKSVIFWWQRTSHHDPLALEAHTAMSSPVSVSVANLVMEDVEERALYSYDVQLPFWKRSVDDVCTVVPKNRIQHLLDHLNSIEPSIQLTENDGCLPFLDVKIKRSLDGSLSTSVFRKPTHTDRYLNFASHHPLSHKKSVVCTLITRATTHSSLTPVRPF